jgi:hypothetical protein
MLEPALQPVLVSALFSCVGYCLNGSNHCIVGEWAWVLWDILERLFLFVSVSVFFLNRTDMPGM